jgi:hypothetical protein
MPGVSLEHTYDDLVHTSWNEMVRLKLVKWLLKNNACSERGTRIVVTPIVGVGDSQHLAKQYSERPNVVGPRLVPLVLDH